MLIQRWGRQMKIIPLHLSYSQKILQQQQWRKESSSHVGFFSTSSSTIVSENNDTVIRVIGKKYTDTRQYLLLPSNLTLPSSSSSSSKSLESFYKETKIVSLYANRNILFGTTIGSRYKNEYNNNNKAFVNVALPLVKVALQDASMEGEQPQALSTLNGLSAWVRSCLKKENTCTTIQMLHTQIQEGNEASKVALEAITAIATGIPRPGHSVVGIGTYRDGKDTWEALAKEYTNTNNTTSLETHLFQQAGGEVIKIEYLADKSESYLKEAGGTMARLLFW